MEKLWRYPDLLRITIYVMELYKELCMHIYGITSEHFDLKIWILNNNNNNYIYLKSTIHRSSIDYKFHWR